MPAALSNFFRALGQALSLALWRRPGGPAASLGFGAFLASCALALACFLIQDRALGEGPMEFFGDGGHAHASYYLLALVAAWLAARLLQRPVLWLPLATLAVLVGIPWTALSLQLPQWLANADELQLQAWRILLAFGGAIALWRTIAFLSAASPPWRHALATLVFGLVLAWPWYWQQSAWFWYPPDVEEDAAPTPAPTGIADQAAPGFDPERLLARQPELLDAQLRALRPQSPGRTDLYAIGFAGDASESVFRNEVEYFGRLLAGRFGAGGHTLELVNHPGTLSRLPLASLDNLRQALAGVGARMDRDQDILWLFLTSHGSQDHRLLVDLDPLPMAQIDPDNLRRALDDAGIRWRVVVVSACYSGGFLDALEDAHTLVIAAARADRTSFGCGNDSRVTWFGKAFLTEALNQTTDLRQAFALASRQVREWELAEGNTPSVPQLREGPAIAGKLRDWQAELAPAAPVPFEPDAGAAQGAAESRR